MKRHWLTLIIVALSVVALAAWSGCGGDDSTDADGQAEDTITVSGPPATTGAASDFEARMAELENLEATVEVKQDGESMVIWSSKEDNWRWQDPNDEGSYVIYRGDENKLWIVDGDTASELPNTGAEGQLWWSKNPAAMITAFTEFSYGDIVDDVWEARFPMGTITIELKGPEGLPSKMTIEQEGETQVTEFVYTDVGSVPDELFELPSGVSVQSVPGLEDLENLGAEIPSR